MILKSDNLPTEIIESILCYLPRSSLYKCIYVNKSWSLSACALFYKEITISKDDFNLSDRSYYIRLYRKRFEKLIIDSPCYFQEDNQDSESFLRWIFGDFPGLKVIDFSKDKALFSRLFPLVRSSEFMINLPRIEEIIVRDFYRVPKDSSSLSEVLTVYHLPLCRRVRKTIKRLSFSNVTLRSWMDCIHIYQRLTHLTIHNDHPFKVPKNYDESLSTFFLCQCPSLIDFTLLNNFYVSDKCNEFPKNIHEICQKIIRHERSSIIVNEDIPKYALSGPHFNLTTLLLSLPTINTSQMKYFISHMPSLKSLKMRLSRTNIHTWLDQNDETTILQFAKHLSLLKI